MCKKLTQSSIARIQCCEYAIVCFVLYACGSGIIANDQSNNVYFKNYASSILETLPNDSVLFINYDQQWTSIRYMQECEGLRKDITSINLSMMSYEWWSIKHELYPSIQFPGSHYNANNGGFNLKQLFDANNGFNGNVFIGGRLSFPDDSYLRRYDEVPHGIVRRIIKKSRKADAIAEVYRKESRKTWQIIAKNHAEGLPPLSQFGDETWEWTIRREFYDHLVARAAHLLDMAVSLDKSNISKLKSVVEACAWLEVARVNDEISTNNPGIWKNLGLAYMTMVRSEEKVFPKVSNLFQHTENSHLLDSISNIWWDEENKEEWKTWSSTRWEKMWGHFLKMDGAKTDPSYDQVKSIYETVLERAKR